MFRSTRDVAETPRAYSFEESILLGWAHDGGMLLPAAVPRVTPETLEQWRPLAYPQLAVQVLRLFVAPAELSDADLADVVARSFGSFGCPEVVRVRTVAHGVPHSARATVHVAELWHGRSLAFKDLGMSLLTQFLQHFLKKRGTHLNVLVGTSGDTGSSAVEAVKGLANMNLVVLFPEGRISTVQRQQMTVPARDEPNLAVWGVEGTSDDLDVPLARLFEDAAFRAAHSLGSLNSVNVARVLAQTVHFFFAYFQATADAAARADEQPTVAFAVPTGAAGHVAAAIIAKKMGLPMEAILAATNENNVFCRFVNTGVLEKLDHVTVTNSPSMDIQVPYNVERILALLLPSWNVAAAHIQTYYATGKLVLSEDELQVLRDAGLVSADVSSAQVEETMASAWRTSRYLLDPHSAVGVYAAVAPGAVPARVAASGAVVCIMCAHAAKFPATLAHALGSEAAAAEALQDASAHDGPHVRGVASLAARDAPYLVLRRASEHWARDWELAVRLQIEAWDAARADHSDH